MIDTDCSGKRLYPGFPEHRLHPPLRHRLLFHVFKPVRLLDRLHDRVAALAAPVPQLIACAPLDRLRPLERLLYLGRSRLAPVRRPVDGHEPVGRVRVRPEAALHLLHDAGDLSVQDALLPFPGSLEADDNGPLGDHRP